jgi:hypothetical protein
MQTSRYSSTSDSELELCDITRGPLGGDVGGGSWFCGSRREPRGESVLLTSVKLALNEPQVHSQSSVKRQKQLCIGLAHSDSRDSSVEYMPSLIADTSFPVSRLPLQFSVRQSPSQGSVSQRQYPASSYSSAFSSWSLSL